MTRLLNGGLLVTVVGLLLELALYSPAAAQFAVYEDWTSLLIRSDRWQGNESFGGQEARREIGFDINGNPKLKLRYRREGSTASNAGNGSSSIFLSPTDPTKITAIKMNFTVTKLTMNTCAANNAGNTTRARPAIFSLRERLLKVAVWIERSVRRIVLHFPTSFPWQPTWRQLACALGATS